MSEIPISNRICTLNAPYDTFGLSLGYMLGGLYRVYPEEFEGRKQELKEIVDRYIENTGIIIRDRDIYEQAFSPELITIGSYLSDDIRECTGAPFFMAMTLFFGKYISAKADNFIDFVSVFPETEFKDAILYGLGINDCENYNVKVKHYIERN